MTQNAAPLAESFHIVIAGMTNAGKSSLLNALFQKEIAVVSERQGTTTDPVTRKMELGALGACSVTDTAGLDDADALAPARIAKSRERILSADFVLFATPCDRPLGAEERSLFDLLNERKIPFMAVLTFADKADEKIAAQKEAFFTDAKIQSQRVSCAKTQARGAPPNGMESLLRALESRAAREGQEISPLDGIVRPGQTIILVTPIDGAAPKGRLILPQVETLRDALDKNCRALVVQESGLQAALDSLKNPPDLVVTDSQAFKQVAAILPPGQALTSFSILFARKKGDIDYFLKSLKALEHFPADGRVLIMEACSHHRKEDDIGTVKIPAIFKKKFGNGVQFFWSRQTPEQFADGAGKSGADGFPPRADIAIHCGACMITRRQMLERLRVFKEAEIPVINYGLFLAWANGLLPRAAELLGRPL